MQHSIEQGPWQSDNYAMQSLRAMNENNRSMFGDECGLLCHNIANDIDKMDYWHSVRKLYPSRNLC